MMDINQAIVDENKRLKDLLRLQTSRADKYLEFIEKFGGMVEAVTREDYITPMVSYDGKLETSFMTTERISMPTTVIGFRGHKEQILQEIDKLCGYGKEGEEQ